MKNLKKVLALVTVACLLLSCVPALASSYSDVADSASYAEAVQVLSDLGIFTGYEDGTFQPDKTITRAEAAAVITRFLGQENTAKAMAGDTQFTDMADAQWATGYVNFGVQKGYINGMGDGTYAPSNDVTYEQIVKMIVAALGWTPAAEDQGGYPSGYLSIASQTGVTKGTSGSNGTASRATVARLLYNALTVEKMKVVKYNSDGTREYGESYDVVVEKDLGMVQYEGVVEATYITDAKGQPTPDAKKTVRIAYDRKNDNAKDPEDNNYAGTITVEIGESDALKYLGYRVTAFVEENEKTGENTLVSIYPRGSKNNVVTIAASDLADNCLDGYTVKYWKDRATDSKVSSLDLNETRSALHVYSNNDEVATTVTTDANGSKTLADVKAALQAAKGVITFISNDSSNGEYEYVLITTYTAQFVVGEIDRDNYIITPDDSLDDDGTAVQYTVDPEDDQNYTFIKDGKTASFEDIEEGDTLSIVGDPDDNNIIFYVSSNKVEGKIARRSGDQADGYKYTIDGTQYEALNDPKEVTDQATGGKTKVARFDVGDEGTFYLNADGYILAADTTSDSNGNYGYYIGTGKTDNFGATWSLKFVDENGNVQIKDLATKVKFGQGTAGSSTNVNDTLKANGTSDAKYKYTYTTATGTKESDLDYNIFRALGIATGDVQLFKYETNSSDQITKLITPAVKATGEDDKIFTVNTSFGVTASDKKEYKANVNGVGSLRFDDATVVFTTAKNKDTHDEDNVSVSTIESVFTDGHDSNPLTAYDVDNRVAGAIVVSGAQTDIEYKANVVVVTGISDVKFDDDKGILIEGLQNGREVSFNVCDAQEDQEGYSAENLNVGDVIMVKEGANFVSNIELYVKYNVTNKTAAIQNNLPVTDSSDNKIAYSFGNLTDRDGKEITINGANVYAGGANVVLVPTNNTKGIKVSSLGVINTTKYTYQAFVRNYDDDSMIDVVLYQTEIAQ